jgi:surfeit locus 1 family protein
MTASTTRPLRWTDWLFAVLMLVLAAVCAFLGAWQMDRLAEKDALVCAHTGACGRSVVQPRL